MIKLMVSSKCLKVAVIGSGPSGFYAVNALLKHHPEIFIDIFDKLPTPFGLIRGGVAPDHQQMKNLAHYFDKTVKNNPEKCRFFGNLTIGRDIPIDELRQHYHAVIFAYGAETDKKLNIPGEDLIGARTATGFVGWYNGHPEFSNRQYDLSQKNAIIIGMGNVAIDVCRILCKNHEELRKTDMPDYALSTLSESKIKKITLVGRGSPLQASFTPIELHKLSEIDDCQLIIDPKELELNEINKELLVNSESNNKRQNYELLQTLAKRKPRKSNRTIELKFYLQAREFKGNTEIENIVFEKTNSSLIENQIVPLGTGTFQTMKAGLVFRSIGYHGIPIAGVPFNKKTGIIPNIKGQVIDENNNPISDLFTAGWIKRGAQGVLGTNKPCSEETVKTLLNNKNLIQKPIIEDRNAILNLVYKSQAHLINYQDWERINQLELKRGEKKAKPREKFTTSEELIRATEKEWH